MYLISCCGTDIYCSNPGTAGKFKQRVHFIVNGKELAYQLLCKHPVWQLETREKEKQHTPLIHPFISHCFSVFVCICAWSAEWLQLIKWNSCFILGIRHQWCGCWSRLSEALTICLFSPHLQIMGSFPTHCLKMLWKRWISSLSQTSKCVTVMF